MRITLKGGVYQQREQRAVIEFLCANSTGLEGEWESEDKYEGAGGKARREDKDGKKDEKEGDGDEGGFSERQLKKKDAALIWEGYKRSPDDKVDTLFLTWHTKYACENNKRADEPAPSESVHWGFFTWMIILWVYSGHYHGLWGLGLLTCMCFCQGLPVHCRISHLWLVAQL